MFKGVFLSTSNAGVFQVAWYASLLGEEDIPPLLASQECPNGVGWCNQDPDSGLTFTSDGAFFCLYHVSTDLVKATDGCLFLTITGWQLTRDC